MLDERLFGRTRAALLRELYANPDRRISFNELVRRLKSGPGAISRELAMLTQAGLVVEQREGNQRLLSAGVASPVFSEIRAFIAKASGVPSGRRPHWFSGAQWIPMKLALSSCSPTSIR